MDSGRRRTARNGTKRRPLRAGSCIEGSILNHFQPVGSIKATSISPQCALDTARPAVSTVVSTESNTASTCISNDNESLKGIPTTGHIEIDDRISESQTKSRRSRYASLAQGHCSTAKRHRSDAYVSSFNSNSTVQSSAQATTEQTLLNTGVVKVSSTRSFGPTSRVHQQLPTPPVSPDNSENPDDGKPRVHNTFWATRERPRRQRVPDSVKKIPELHEIWQGLEERDTAYYANPLYIQRHPALKCRMRSLLADWMIEVAEEFALHRETYYASMNFVDRYLSRTSDVPKSDIQLIGVSCLFTAAKIHEIYPPRLSKFADLTDGACTDDEILLKEMDILKTLQWNLSPVTAISWLEMYLQTASSMKLKTSTFSDFTLYPQYFKTLFYGACQLLDFSTLDYNSVKYSPGVLAATALYLFAGSDIDVSAVTGFRLEDIYPCFQWMEVYAIVLDRHNMYSVVDRAFKRHVAPDDVHNIQAHCNPYRLLDQVSALRLSRASADRAEPSKALVADRRDQEHGPSGSDTSVSHGALQTPPRSQGECLLSPQCQQKVDPRTKAVLGMECTPPKTSCQ